MKTDMNCREEYARINFLWDMATPEAHAAEGMPIDI